MDLQLRTGPASDGTTTRPAAATADGGKTLPATGKELPPPERTEPPPPEAASVRQAVARIQEYLTDSRRSLQFELDDSSGRTVIRVVNPESGEVIRQIPGEEVLQIAAAIEREGLRLLDRRA
jgi:flagellar protein FlaG